MNTQTHLFGISTPGRLRKAWRLGRLLGSIDQREGATALDWAVVGRIYQTLLSRPPYPAECLFLENAYTCATLACGAAQFETD